MANAFETHAGEASVHMELPKSYKFIAYCILVPFLGGCSVGYYVLV